MCKVKNQKIWRNIFFILGLLIVVCYAIPYLILGDNSYVQMHDQLDGEVLNYIYQAKYLFSNSSIIPEFMGGMNKIAMTPPAPLFVLIFKVFSPFASYVIIHMLCIGVAFSGMYFLLQKLSVKSGIAFLVAMLFCFLPFYPTYGLSIPGQAFLVLSFYHLYHNQNIKRSFIYIAIYALASSFTLTGFAILMCGGIYLIYLLLRNKKKEFLISFFGVLILLGVYIITNFSLLINLLNPNSDFVSHRVEMVLHSSPSILKLFWNLFIYGISYAEAYQKLIFIFIILILSIYGISLLLTRIFKTKQIMSQTQINLIKQIGFLLLFCVILSMIGAILQSEGIVGIRENMGGFVKTFQFSRVLWLAPTAWYLMLGLSLQLAVEKIGNGKTLMKAICVMIPVFILTNGIYKANPIYHNLRLWLYPNTYDMLTWKDAYAEDVFAQIDSYIGQDKSTYKTVSLGIYPSAALYNGFYCLDGYSNNYQLEYKHEFRKIIARELEKNEENRVYFDLWGNRCYLLTTETNGQMMIPKTSSLEFEHLDINCEQLIEMNAKYLFSSSKIVNAEELGLVLTREEPFVTDESYYQVWLYEIKSE